MWEIILSFLVSTSFAQGFDSTKAYQDYQFALETYQNANTDFEKSKAFYLTNQTLTLKEDARKKLLAMLQKRDTLQNVYLTALRIKLIEAKNDTAKIEEEIKWYQDHIANYKDNDSTESLFSKSLEAEIRYKDVTSKIINEALFLISLGEEVALRQEHEAIYTQLKTSVKDESFFARWFSDIDLNIENLKQNENLAKSQIEKSYDDAVETLNLSTKLLSQLNDFLTEVSVSIKNQQ